MPHGSVTETIPAPSAAVFRLLHDYERRLEWDTLLQSACLDDDWAEAQLHATSVCTGRWYLGGIALKTEYVSFSPPEVAAVKMLNRPPFFDTFAATIRHLDLSDGSSSIEYKYNFTARPSWLRWLLHPVMTALFRWETARRLQALRRFFPDHPGDALRTTPNAADRLPSKDDFCPHLPNLDEVSAWRNFGGLTLDEAKTRFAENPLYYQEAFMFMGPIAFLFYFPVLDHHLRNVPDEESDDDYQSWIISHCIRTQFESETMDRLRFLIPAVGDLAGFVRDHIRLFGDDDSGRQRVADAWSELVHYIETLD